MGQIPIIRLELESMKHSIYAAFSEHAASMDLDIKASVEAFCTPGNPKGIIKDQVDRVLKAAIEDEIKSFYAYGDGRKIIREAVQKRLLEDIANSGD